MFVPEDHLGCTDVRDLEWDVVFLDDAVGFRKFLVFKGGALRADPHTYLEGGCGCREMFIDFLAVGIPSGHA